MKLNITIIALILAALPALAIVHDRQHKDLSGKIDKTVSSGGAPQTGPGIHVIHENGRAGLFDGDKKEWILECRYDSIIEYATNMGHYVYLNGQVGFYEKNRFLIPLKYASIQKGTYSSSLDVAVTASGKKDYYTKSGKRLNIKGSYDSITPDNDWADSDDEQVWIVKKNGRYGALDHTGRLIIPVKHKEYVTPDYTYKIIFTDPNPTKTGTTWTIYMPNGRLVASKFFYNDRRRELEAWLRRYGK